VKFPARALPRVAVAAALLASLASAGCASARSPAESVSGSEFSREGAYLGIYGIKSYEDFDTSGSGVDTGDSDLGIGGKLGLRFAPAFAVELVAENVKGFEIESGTVESDLDLTNYGVMGKFFIAHERIQPYLLAGAGVASADVSGFDFDDDGWFGRLGLGVDAYVTENFALFGEVNYNRMMGDVNDLHHIDLQVGLMFRF
jgi:opacity protein-like surface antigen